MLSAHNRLVSSADFAAVIRSGRRARRATLTVHAVVPEPPTDVTLAVPGHEPKVGLVVSKAVGNSVIRHRVARRLRALMRQRLAQLPADSKLVIRAHPGAGDADSTTLASDIDAALAKIVRNRLKDRSA